MTASRGICMICGVAPRIGIIARKAGESNDVRVREDLYSRGRKMMMVMDDVQRDAQVQGDGWRVGGMKGNRNTRYRMDEYEIHGLLGERIWIGE